MRKIDLIKSIALKSDLHKDQISVVLECMMDSIVAPVQRGESGTLIGFGTFEVKERKARQAYNPSTKALMVVPCKKVVRFRLGGKMTLEKPVK